MSESTKLVSLRKHGRALTGVAILSALVNVLHLSGSIFMLEIYDRVLPSRSVPTLVGLATILLMLYAFQAIFDIIRGRILSRIGASLDESLGETVFQLVLARPLRGRTEGDGQEPLRDLDRVRGFLAGGGPAALFDLPWMPLYLTICFAFHPWLGLTAVVGAVALVLMTLLTEIFTRRSTREAVSGLHARSAVAQAGQRNAEVIRAMGMAGQIGQRWDAANRRILHQQQRTSDIGGGFASVSKVVRMMLQSMVLAVGAYLVMGGEVTAGVMIASSILASRALAPVELAIGNWKGFIGARQSWKRLGAQLAEEDAKPEPLPLPAPRHNFAAEHVFVAPPGERRPVIEDVKFSLTAGDGLGVIGPSGSGKSSLARALVGIWPATSGKIRLDGAALDQWTPERLGTHVGYLPQDVELFAGTIAQNIARFEEGADPEAVIAAARTADVHDMILKLPKGYDTEIGLAGMALSGGQRQRIALARALFGDPFLVVLDEPNSNLDNEGDVALTNAIRKVRERGGIAIVIAHRPSALACLDQMLVLAAGKQVSFGPKDEIMGRFVKPRAAQPDREVPLRIVESVTSAGEP
jgi:ATP-binding cassette, subfamily C, bacterial PrsD